MICKNCNSSIDDQSSFCPYCGTFLNYSSEDDPNEQYNIKQNYNNNYSTNNYQQFLNGKDEGDSIAKLAQVLGILSFFFGPILSIISLVLCSKYKKIGNGNNKGKVKVGKICSLITLISAIILTVLTICLVGVGIYLQTNLDNTSNIQTGEDLCIDEYYYDSSFNEYANTFNSLVYDSNEITIYTKNVYFDKITGNLCIEYAYTNENPDYEINFCEHYVNTVTCNNYTLSNDTNSYIVQVMLPGIDSISELDSYLTVLKITDTSTNTTIDSQVLTIIPSSVADY